MGGTRFMVQWEEHPSHLATRLGQLLEHQTLVDVTLMCNTHTLRVHRAVLAACSPYFETILQRQLGMYPLIVLKDMQFSVLKSLIEFMYCGETSVTEDNLSALLQAAKFFQVKGLSAMTKEALGLTSTPTPKTTTTVNGEAARKAFVGRSKRVGMQQTFVASGLKTVTASGSHVHGPGGDVHTVTTGKTIFQTTPKSMPVRQDTHHQQQQQQQQQQQTDTAQLLLSLSGSEFPKQTFHTVSKNVRFHHGVTPGSAVTVEPSRTCSLESSVVKKQEPAATMKSEVIDRVPVVTPNGGVKSTSVVLPAQVAEKGLEQQAVPEKAVEGTKEDLASSQVFYVEDGPCKRGRPLKRQMNLVFQEKVLTDAEMALQKEAEASRKALEMLQQEMSTGDETPAPATETVQQKVKPMTKPSQQINNMMTTTRILPKETAVAAKASAQKASTVSQATAVNMPTPETGSQNVIYQVAGNTLPTIDSNSNETNIVYQLQDGVISGQEAGTNIVYQVADSAVLAGQDANSQNIIYQVADNSGTSAEGNNTNIIYQVTDGGGSGSSTTVSQYMEVLKEAGLPSDVPILLESSDGHYVSVNEEVLMNIMNGGVVQVSDGSIVGGEGVQFIVQEVQEVNEGQVDSAGTSTEQSVTDTNVASTSVAASTAVTTTSAVTATVTTAAAAESTSTITASAQEAQVSGTNEAAEPKPVVANASVAKHSTYKPAKGQQSKLKALSTVEGKERARVFSGTRIIVAGSPSRDSAKLEDKEELAKQDKSTPMEIDEPESTPESVSVTIPEPPTHSDEVITGDNYGEEAMEGFAVMETKDDVQKETLEPSVPQASSFEFPSKSKKKSPVKNEPAKEAKTEDAPANSSMSVEQALQAMMGESSDTEMEVCANTGSDGTTKVKPIISHHDTKGHSTPNEGSIDEETEDLRLVLSPEDESIKVEDESQSAEGSMNDSFTLALSSPDSTGNEKVHLEADSMAESAEGSQSETKPPEAEQESLELKNDTVHENEPEYLEFNAEAVNENESQTKDTFKSNSAVAASSNEGSVLVSGDVSTDSNSVDLKVVESIEESSVLETAQDQIETGKVTPSGSHSEIFHLNPETTEENVMNDQPCTTDKPDDNLKISEPDIDIENTSNSGALPDLTPNTSSDDIKEEGDENSSIQLESIDHPPDAISRITNSEVGISLPLLDSDTSTDDVVPADPEEKVVASTSLETKSDSEDIPKNAMESTSFSLSLEEPSNSVSKEPATDTDNSVPPESAMRKSETVNESLSNVLTSENKETESITQPATLTDDTKIDNGEDTKLDEGGTVRTVNTTENQDDPEMLPDNIIVDENGIEGKGTVTSPNKDIPYAVGLLPLNIALEKFQAMPEYHPRKTRSASSGKESASDVPASRLKRKCSSTSETSEKKLKSGDGEGSLENEGITVATEESEEGDDKHSPLEGCPIEGSSKAVESPVDEDHNMETENKVEPLPSMMELVSDSSEAV